MAEISGLLTHLSYASLLPLSCLSPASLLPLSCLSFTCNPLTWFSSPADETQSILVSVIDITAGKKNKQSKISLAAQKTHTLVIPPHTVKAKNVYYKTPATKHSDGGGRGGGSSSSGGDVGGNDDEEDVDVDNDDIDEGEAEAEAKGETGAEARGEAGGEAGRGEEVLLAFTSITLMSFSADGTPAYI
jgi:hypothetical protein